MPTEPEIRLDTAHYGRRCGGRLTFEALPDEMSLKLEAEQATARQEAAEAALEAAKQGRRSSSKMWPGWRTLWPLPWLRGVLRRTRRWQLGWPAESAVREKEKELHRPASKSHRTASRIRS